MKSNFIKILYTSCFIAFISTINAQTEKAKPLDLPKDRCQARCLIAKSYNRVEIAIPTYTGDDEKILSEFVKDTSFVTKGQSTKWAKKQRDKNCVSKNPDDCLVWCLVEMAAEEAEIDLFLTDTTVTNEYVIEYYTVEKLVEQNEFSEWQEIVCPNKVDKYLLNQIRLALEISPSNSNIYDKKTRKKMLDYQKKNGLPIGKLNIKALEHLGIETW